MSAVILLDEAKSAAGPHGPRAADAQSVGRFHHQPRRLCHEEFAALRDLAALTADGLGALQLANTDELTGLCNRSGFQTAADQAITECAQTGQPATLVILELLGLQQITNWLGQDEGDRALIEFAGFLLEAFWESELVARVGGDEFCVLLTAAGKEQAGVAVSHLRSALNEHNAQPGNRYPLCFSAGVIGYSRKRHACLWELLGDADEQRQARRGRRASYRLNG